MSLQSLNELYPGRQLQIQQLIQIFSKWIPSPPAVVIHGLEATGKSTLVRNVLSLSGVSYAIIQSQECVTGRHLLERTLAACVDLSVTTNGEITSKSRYARCESLAVLAASLQTLLEGVDKTVLVFDGIDHQREEPPTLFPALARLGEIIKNLTIVFIVTFPRQRFLHTAGTPHIHFPTYTREQAVQIVSRNPPQIFIEPSLPSATYSEQAHEEDKEWLWSRFCAATWDSLAKNIARDVVTFRALAMKLWRPFVASIVDGTYGVRDFSKLMVAKRTIFQSEEMLVDSAVAKPISHGPSNPVKYQHQLPYFSKYLLCAAYLASFNPARTDSTFFMRSTDKKRRRKGGRAGHGRSSQNRKSSTRILRRHLPPASFPLDRLLAIFRSITPEPLAQDSRILTNIASLTSLGLLTRSGAALDVLDQKSTWKVSASHAYVTAAGRSVGLAIEDFEW